MIDKSAAFRMDPDVPLVVAEVNPEDMRTHAEGHRVVPELHDDGPVTALAPLHRAARIDRMVVSTYQSVSGAGQAGMHELDAQWTKLDGRAADLARAGTFDAPLVEGEVWSKPIAGNVIPLAGSVKEAGLHVGGVEDGARVAQDPPRRRDQVHGHVRARARVRRVTP